jgi:hypothetical protein
MNKVTKPLLKEIFCYKSIRITIFLTSEKIVMDIGRVLGLVEKK